MVGMTRITNRMVKNATLRNIQQNLRAMNRLQEDLSSGKVIRKPSDDPIKVSRIMSFTTSLSKNAQYRRNINSATSWLEVTEDALHGVNEVLQRARELAIAGANGAMPPAAREAIASEVDELTGVLVQLGNTSYEGRQVFGGFQTTTPPFVRADVVAGAVTYGGDDGAINWEVAPGVTIQGNINGGALFDIDLLGPPTSPAPWEPDIFAHMNQLTEALNNGDMQLIDESIGNMAGAIDHVLDKRAALGAIVNGLELTLANNEAENINFTGMRSELEDVDFAEAIMHFTSLENVYRASLSAGARVMQPTLLDFLR